LTANFCHWEEDISCLQSAWFALTSSYLLISNLSAPVGLLASVRPYVAGG
jgi:hypothetical protein